jgi:hypothetical protein
MSKRVFLPISFLIASAIACALPSFAQDRGTASDRGDGGSGGRLAAAGDWPLESVELKSGTVYRGIVLSVGEDEIEFMEIVRRPNKPMFLVIRPVAVREIAKVDRLPQAQREQILRRTTFFRFRAEIEAGRMDRIDLKAFTAGGVRKYRYSGNWFALESTADEEMTRRCIVRIEQVFRAYRLLLRPRTSPRRRLEVLLLGSIDEYRTYLTRRGLSLKTPSFYLAHQNRIVAASELTRFAERLAESRAQHAELLQQYERLEADLPQRLQRMMEELRSKGYSRDQAVDLVAAQKNAWAHEHQAIIDKIDVANRRNELQFAKLTREMFERLYHEAFHAYLENFVYPHDRYDVPRWLNEGLAQIFEGGQLDGDTLRIGAPNRSALLAVQDLIAKGKPLHLADLLAADETQFLIAHEGANAQARQTYYSSWALAYYLIFMSERPVWGTAALDTYVKPASAELLPTTRFERLVGMPLEPFTQSWRQAMMQLKPPRE